MSLQAKQQMLYWQAAMLTNHRVLVEDIPPWCALSCASVLAHRPTMDCHINYYVSYTKNLEEEKSYSNVNLLRVEFQNFHNVTAFKFFQTSP